MLGIFVRTEYPVTLSSPGPTCLMLAEVDTPPQPPTSISFHLQQQSGLIRNRVPLTLFVGLSCQAP